MAFLRKIIPWRIQTMLGWRPRKKTFLSNLLLERRAQTVNKNTSIPLEKIVYPYHVEKDLHKNFKAVSIEKIHQFCSEYSITEIPDVAFLTVENICTIIADQSVIDELSFDPLHRASHPALSISHYPKPIHLKGKTLVVSTLGADINYFHWTLDLCQKFGFTQSLGHSIDSFDHILINKISHRFQEEWLSLLKIPLDKIIETKSGSYFKMENAIIPSYIPHSYFGYSFIRESALELITKHEGSTPKNIYISRKKTKGRKIINETELLAALEGFGFETIILEDLSLKEQVKLFHYANFIIMPHGAAMTNLVYCQSGTKLIELHDEKTPLNTDFFPYINFTGMIYGYLLCESIPNEETTHFNFRDLIVNIQEVHKLITTLSHQ